MATGTGGKASWVMMAVKDIVPNPANPRLVKDDKFRKLVQSVQDFPAMLELRPIVVNAANVVLGGNMRLRACREAGIKAVPVIVADSLTIEQEREFVIKDNVGFGEWDWDVLANGWNVDELELWGMDVPTTDEGQGYTSKITAPTYEITGAVPAVADLMDQGKRDALVEEIRKATGVAAEVKAFLINAAQRHLVFDYQQIAEFYAHATPTVQSLMEASALVIIDYDKAIAGGYVQLSDAIREALVDDYGE